VEQGCSYRVWHTKEESYGQNNDPRYKYTLFHLEAPTCEDMGYGVNLYQKIRPMVPLIVSGIATLVVWFVSLKKGILTKAFFKAKI